MIEFRITIITTRVLLIIQLFNPYDSRILTSNAIFPTTDANDPHVAERTASKRTDPFQPDFAISEERFNKLLLYGTHTESHIDIHYGLEYL